MPPPILSHGAVERMVQPNYQNEYPVVQILSIEPHPNGRSSRAELSDGVTSVHATVPISMAPALKPYSVIRIAELSDVYTNGRKQITLMKFEVLSDGTAKIGNPKPLAFRGAHEHAGVHLPPAKTQPPPPAAPRTVIPEVRSAFVAAGTAGPFAHCVPIKELHPYLGKVSIKVRVTRKTPKKSYNTNTGSGDLFSADLIDSQGTEIRATAFKATCEKFFPVLQEGKCFVISKFQLRNNPKANGNEVQLGMETECDAVMDDPAIPFNQFHFIKIADLENTPANTTVDVIGVIVRDDGSMDVVSKKKREPLRKRSVVIRDESNRKIELTLWGEDGEKIPVEVKSPVVVAVKRARVNDYSGKSVSNGFDGGVFVNPNLPEAKKLRDWYSRLSTAERNAEIQSLTAPRGGILPADKRVWVEELRQMEASDKAQFAVCRVNVSLNFDPAKPPFYVACKNMLVNEFAANGQSTRVCGRKMNPETGACPHCNTNEWTVRYILNVAMSDPTGTTYATAFDEAAKIFLDGRPADEMYAALTNGREAEIKDFFEKITNRNWTVKLRIRQSNRSNQYSNTSDGSGPVTDGPVLRKDIVTAVPFAYEAESKLIQKELDEYHAKRKLQLQQQHQEQEQARSQHQQLAYEYQQQTHATYALY